MTTSNGKRPIKRASFIYGTNSKGYSWDNGSVAFGSNETPRGREGGPVPKEKRKTFYEAFFEEK